LATLAVKAPNRCRPSPHLSSDRGWKWNSRFAVAYSGDDLANTPTCDGAMVRGPLRNSAYSTPMAARRHSLA
jgi:hypothetical protein